MTKPYQDEKPGYGKGRFILGYGEKGVFGHVALFIQFVPEPGFYAVEWRVKNLGFAKEARHLVEQAVTDYVRRYITEHLEYGLRVMIVEVISDELRQNDYKRAVNLALCSALEDIGLPVPPIFAL